MSEHENPQTWLPIETAPKDGTAVLLLSARQVVDTGLPDVGVLVHEPKCAIGHWWPEGDSWVDEHGRLDGDAHHLAVTGVWLPQQGGWFQPNEVTHWMPLPAPPTEIGRVPPATKEHEQEQKDEKTLSRSDQPQPGSRTADLRGDDRDGSSL